MWCTCQVYLPGGSGAPCEKCALPVTVVPAKAGIQSVDSAFSKVWGVDSRFRGNDEAAKFCGVDSRKPRCHSERSEESCSDSFFTNPQLRLELRFTSAQSEIPRCHENGCAEGTLECGIRQPTDSYRLSLGTQGGPAWRDRTPRRFAHFHAEW